MTRVESVRVEGLAGRAGTQEYELFPDVNVLFGLNGRGKTSLLKVIYSALQDETTMLREIAIESASVRFYSHQHDQEVDRSISKAALRVLRADAGERVYLDDEGRLHSRPANGPGGVWKTTGDVPTVRFLVKFMQTSRLYDAARNRGRNYLRDEAEVAESFVDAVERAWSQFTTQTLSEVTQAQQTGLATILEQAMFGAQSKSKGVRLDAKIAYQRSKDFLKRQGIKKFEPIESFTRQYEENPRLSSLVQEIDKIERRIEIAEEPRRKLQALVDEFFEDSKHLELQDSGVSFRSGDVQIPMGNLSSGEKQLIRILLEVANAGRATILIDEPELSLHIDWQRKLLSALHTINPQAQIIVATHSPEIMAEVRDDRIFRV